MAKKRRAPTPASFKKGKSGNPRGRPKSAYNIDLEPLDWGAARQVNFDRNMLKRYMQVVQELSEDEIRARLRSRKATVIEKTVCRFWLMALNGNTEAYKMCLEYTVGKPRTEIEITRPNKFDGWTTDQLNEYRQNLIARNRETLERLEQRQLQKAKVIDITPQKDVTPIDEEPRKPVSNGSD